MKKKALHHLSWIFFQMLKQKQTNKNLKTNTKIGIIVFDFRITRCKVNNQKSKASRISCPPSITTRTVNRGSYQTERTFEYRPWKDRNNGVFLYFEASLLEMQSLGGSASFIELQFKPFFSTGKICHRKIFP